MSNYILRINGEDITYRIPYDEIEQHVRDVLHGIAVSNAHTITERAPGTEDEDGTLSEYGWDLVDTAWEELAAIVWRSLNTFNFHRQEPWVRISRRDYPWLDESLSFLIVEV
jgi:hypothetical protein